MPGARIFINEDATEAAKRKIVDLRKYVTFHQTKGIPAQIKGEGIFMDGKMYQYDDLSHMPNGLTLKDSRTKLKNGVYAFQSGHSPLSSLFECTIKRNGIAYPSAEHAFQHAKAVENKDFIKARAILAEPSPHEVLQMAKGIKTTQEWIANRQPIVMEEIVRLKREQVKPFNEELANTVNYTIVENTRSPFWGVGHTKSEADIFNGNYLGHNQLGRILMQVRDNY